MSKSILPTALEGQERSGLRRALRAAALIPVMAGGLTFVTANMVRAEEEPVTPEEIVEEVVVAPTIDEIVPRPGGLTVLFTKAADTAPLFHLVQAWEGNVVKATEIVVGDVSTASLTGLTNGTEYDVTVVGINLLGFTDVSEIVKATPVADGSAVIAPLAVSDIDVDRTAHSATVTWSAPSNDGGSPILLYVVNAVDQSTGKLAFWRNLPADARSASLAPLTHGVAYDINVFAVSAAGFGAVETLADVLGSSALENPGTPSLPWATAFVNDDGDVVANWGAAVEHGVPVLGYNAVIIQDGEMVGWSVIGPEGRSGEVDGLDETQDADVYVFTTSAIGFGPTVKITLEAPEAPAED
ncbi:MAG TPA: fibronectin type III domain-containing protein [Acidimicrobiales bacterium]|nr:fibronectin type III domain-containing protein [Acidimicrobiales bacterium]